MIFTDIAAGETIFVDANTFVYHFAADPAFGAACSDLLIRIKHEEIEAYTPTHVVNEMTHRLMAIEAMKVNGWPPAGLVQKMRKNPAGIQMLARARSKPRPFTMATAAGWHGWHATPLTSFR